MKRRKILRPVWGLCLAAVFLADALLGFPAVRADEPSGTGEAEWNLAMIGADTAFALGFRGQNVRVGVIDSGVSPHPVFGDKLVGGHNYIADAPDPEDTSDAYGHGTRVAGLITAVAPEAEIVPLKITDSGSVSTSLLCEAIYGGIDEFGCDVLNLSLGVPSDRESLRQAVAYAAKKGVVVVAATGNDGTGEIYYPAAYDSVIGVSAVEMSGRIFR
ncbi:MAG: S8 family serine peptidase, partial [Clostridia bacterium]|nr:S8 family serine peptidase [Clostridia bacterium]